MRLNSGSNVMAFHTAPPPPHLYHSPLQVFSAIRNVAFSCGPWRGSLGTFQKRHTFFPVFSSYAVTHPRDPTSAPACPMITLPLKTRGAPVMVFREIGSATVSVIHFGLPVSASSEMSRPSEEPK